MPAINHEVLNRMHQAPEWFDREFADSICGLFPVLIPGRIYAYAGLLATADRAGRLPRRLTSVFEFGSGYGEGLISLNMFANVQESIRITGSEIVPSDRRSATEVSWLLPHVSSVEVDGIDVLRQSPQSYDLIVANMFGNGDNEQDLHKSFLPVALNALRESGVIVMNSDPKTIENVLDWSGNNVTSYTFGSLADIPDGIAMHPAIVFDKVI